MFWPDFFSGWVNEAIYDALTTAKPSEVADTESGQLLIDTCKHADVLQYVHALNQQSAVTYDYMFGDKDIFQQAAARCEFLTPAFLVGMIQSAAGAPAFFHRTNAEFSLRNNQQILTEFVLPPRSSEDAKALLWQVPYPSLAWAVCVDQVTPLQTPAALSNAEAAATA